MSVTCLGLLLRARKFHLLAILLLCALMVGSLYNSVVLFMVVPATFGPELKARSIAAFGKIRRSGLPGLNLGRSLASLGRTTKNTTAAPDADRHRSAKNTQASTTHLVAPKLPAKDGKRNYNLPSKSHGHGISVASSSKGGSGSSNHTTSKHSSKSVNLASSNTSVSKRQTFPSSSNGHSTNRSVNAKNKQDGMGLASTKTTSSTSSLGKNQAISGSSDGQSTGHSVTTKHKDDGKGIASTKITISTSSFGKNQKNSGSSDGHSTNRSGTTKRKDDGMGIASTKITSSSSSSSSSGRTVQSNPATSTSTSSTTSAMKKCNPDVQACFARRPQNSRQNKIREMMSHAWSGYKQHCWGGDELHPVSGNCDRGWGVGLTLLDSLDSLYLMGMEEEYKEAREWVAADTSLHFDKVGNVNLFETTIRALGGLLGAHALTGDAIFAKHAKDLGQKLLPGLRGNQYGIPYSDIDVGRSVGSFKGYFASTSEATSLGPENFALSEITGDPSFAKAATAVNKLFHGLAKNDGLSVIEINPNHPSLTQGNVFSLGARGDSYYEYLLKTWLLTGKQDQEALHDYQTSIAGIRKHLVQHTNGPLRLTYIAELFSSGSLNPKMDHLVCFLPGTLALGVHYGASGPEDMDLAKELMRTCYQMYKITGRDLTPEIAFFIDHGDNEIYAKSTDAFDILRPETVESLFYLYRITGDPTYQDWGWEIAQAIEEYAKVPSGGYSSLNNIDYDPSRSRDKMESFFLGETLKYLFLLFDSTKTQVSLDNFIFNTEAHPLRIFKKQVKEGVATA